MGKLAKYRGREVLSTGVEIRNASGGLNAAMKIDPEEYEVDDEVTVVMRCKVDKHRHEKVKDTDGLRLVHILSANDAAIIDDELVSEALDAQARRIEEAHGIHQLPIKLQAAHDAGEHTELVEGCPSCDKERAAAAEEDAAANG